MRMQLSNKSKATISILAVIIIVKIVMTGSDIGNYIKFPFMVSGNKAPLVAAMIGWNNVIVQPVAPLAMWDHTSLNETFALFLERTGLVDNPHRFRINTFPSIASLNGDVIHYIGPGASKRVVFSGNGRRLMLEYGGEWRYLDPGSGSPRFVNDERGSYLRSSTSSAILSEDGEKIMIAKFTSQSYGQQGTQYSVFYPETHTNREIDYQEIYLSDLDLEKINAVTGHNNYLMDLSDDGTRAAYIGRDSLYGDFRIFVSDLESGETAGIEGKNYYQDHSPLFAGNDQFVFFLRSYENDLIDDLYTGYPCYYDIANNKVVEFDDLDSTYNQNRFLPWLSLYEENEIAGTITLLSVNGYNQYSTLVDLLEFNTASGELTNIYHHRIENLEFKDTFGKGLILHQTATGPYKDYFLIRDAAICGNIDNLELQNYDFTYIGSLP